MQETHRVNLYLKNKHYRMFSLIGKKLDLVNKNELFRQLIEEYFYGHDMHKTKEWMEQ